MLVQSRLRLYYSISKKPCALSKAKMYSVRAVSLSSRRTRLPLTAEGFSQRFKLQSFGRSPADDYLPVAHTCFFSLELPAYSSLEVCFLACRNVQEHMYIKQPCIGLLVVPRSGRVVFCCSLVFDFALLGPCSCPELEYVFENDTQTGLFACPQTSKSWNGTLRCCNILA